MAAKTILVTLLVLSVVPILACAGAASPSPSPTPSVAPTPPTSTPTATPAATPSPTPSPSPKPVAKPSPTVVAKSTEQILRDLPHDMGKVNEDMKAFTAKHSFRQLKNDKGEMVWAHGYMTNVGSQAFIYYIPSEFIYKAQGIISDVAFLAANKKLPSETQVRSITDDELIKAVQVEAANALKFIKAQVTYNSTTAQPRNVQWAKDIKEGNPTEAEREHAVTLVNEFYTNYRKGLEAISQGLEQILTYTEVYFKAPQQVAR